MNLRKATVNDTPMLAALDAGQLFCAHWDLPGWQAELAQAASTVWCAVENGTLIGFVALRGAAGMYEITNLAVHAAHTRQGVGTQLLARALAGISGQITLEVSVQNGPAIGLYEKAGFVRRGVRPHFYADGSDALILGKIQ